MKNNIVLVMGFFLLRGTALYALTFNITLSQLAQVDIQLSKNPILEMNFSAFALDAGSTIARYSSMIQSSGQVLLWQQWYSIMPMDMFLSSDTFFILPEHHLAMAHPQTNPFTIIITPEQLQRLAGDVSQIYVSVKQRTYWYNFRDQKIIFYAYSFLMNEYQNLNAVITVTAQGIITPDQYSSLPPDIQAQYPLASGSAV